MNHGYSAVQTARLVSALRWACGRLSEILGVWAGQAAAAGGHDETAVRLMVLSRRLDAHRATFDGLQPDSERLAAWRQAAPADPSLAEALEEIAALQGPTERLAVAQEVLVPQLLGAYRDICRQAAPHCDAALASAAGSLGDDLARHRSDGAAGAVGDASNRAAASAESGLSAAGGLVERSLLRPGNWA